MDERLLVILSSFEVLEHKVHFYHVSMKGHMFLTYHEFFKEIYEYFEDPEDRLMERMDQLGFKVPSTLLTLVKNSIVNEAMEDQVDPLKQMELISRDLGDLEDYLQESIEKAGEESDYVTQNKLIEYSEGICTMKWKLDKIIGSRGGTKKTMTVFEEGIDGDDD